MTKALLDIDSELWKQARMYALQNDLTVNELVTLALERLVHPIAGRPINDTDLGALVGPPAYQVTIEENLIPDWTNDKKPSQINVTPYPGFGSSRPAPKPLKKGR